MTVKVYIWYPEKLKSSILSAINLNSVGHVSMQINDIYISHRPAQYNTEILKQEYTLQNTPENFYKYVKVKTDKFIQRYSPLRGVDNTVKYVKFKEVKSADSENDTYEKECKLKERKADQCIPMDWLNGDKMLKYYKSLSSSDRMYHPVNNNCCTFIVNIIKSSLNCDSTHPCKFCNFNDSREHWNNTKEVFKGLFKLLTKIYKESSNLKCPTLIVKCTYLYIQFNFSGGIIVARVWTPNRIARFLLRLESKKNCLKK